MISSTIMFLIAEIIEHKLKIITESKYYKNHNKSIFFYNSVKTDRKKKECYNHIIYNFQDSFSNIFDDMPH